MTWYGLQLGCVCGPVCHDFWHDHFTRHHTSSAGVWCLSWGIMGDSFLSAFGLLYTLAGCLALFTAMQACLAYTECIARPQSSLCLWRHCQVVSAVVCRFAPL